LEEHFKQDVREVWKRSNFYLLVEGGLATVFATLAVHHSGATDSIVIAFGVFGQVIALVWFIVARGSLFRLRQWRKQVMELDKIVDRH